MQRYKLRQGKLRPDDSGEWVRADEVQDIIDALHHTIDDHPISVGDILWRVEAGGLVRCEIDGFGVDWLNVCDDGNHCETMHLGGDGPYFYRHKAAAKAAEGIKT